MGFIDTVMKLLRRASVIGPHLEAILQAIVRPDNGSEIGETQEMMLEERLVSFQDKMKRLGIISERVGSTNLMRIKIAQQSIELLNQKVAEICFKPIFEASLCGKELSPLPKVLDWLDRCEGELAPSLAVDAPIAPSVGPIDISMHHLERIIDDALLALARIAPNRRIGLTGSVLLRDINSFQTWIPDAEKSADLEFYSYYGLVKLLEINQTSLYEMVPNTDHMTEEVCRKCYGRSLKDMTIHDFLEDPLDIMNQKEPNFGPRGLYSRIVGTSNTSLDLVLELYCLIGQSVYNRVHMGIPFRERFKAIGMEDLLCMTSPMSLVRNIKNHRMDAQRHLMIHSTVTQEIEALKSAVLSFGQYREFVNALFSNEQDVVDAALFYSTEHSMSVVSSRNVSFREFG